MLDVGQPSGNVSLVSCGVRDSGYGGGRETVLSGQPGLYLVLLEPRMFRGGGAGLGVEVEVLTRLRARARAQVHMNLKGTRRV